MSGHISTLICDVQKQVLFVLADELSLTKRMNDRSLEVLFDDESQVKLNMLFERTKTKRSTLNWELSTKLPEPFNTVYCSVLAWLNVAVVRISDQPIQSFFFDLIVENDKPVTLFFPLQTDPSFKYSRLNDELTSIQRELQKKNVRLEELNERLEVLATTDPLTGLYNRHKILEQAKMEFVRAIRERRFFGIALLDLDGLQKINDRYGYAIGDECIRAVAKVVQGATRSYDPAGRIGADEIMVFFSIHSQTQFKAILTRLFNKVQEISIALENGESLKPQVSIGAVDFSSAPLNVDVKDMLALTEKALSTAKTAGGNRIVLEQYDPSKLE